MMTIKRFYPVDVTLPRHAMFRQTDDEKWQINLYMLFKNLPKPRGARKSWYETSQNMVQKLPLEFQSEILEICSIFSGEIGKNTWISVCSALTLLTYGSRNHRHLDIVCWVERYTGIKLPREHGLSRRETVFGQQLIKFINEELKDVTGGDYEIERQLRMCGGRYYVDFSVRHFWDDAAIRDKCYWYLIEFDEEEHALKPNKAADLRRDSEIKQAAPHATIIRVRHDEIEDWFELVRNNNGLTSFEGALLSGIISACRCVKDGKIIIDSASAKKAYYYDWNAVCLKYENQPLRGIQDALDSCNITYEKARTKTSRQLRVSLDSLSGMLHRWWPLNAAESVLLNLKSA